MDFPPAHPTADLHSRHLGPPAAAAGRPSHPGWRHVPRIEQLRGAAAAVLGPAAPAAALLHKNYHTAAGHAGRVVCARGCLAILPPAGSPLANNSSAFWWLLGPHPPALSNPVLFHVLHFVPRGFVNVSNRITCSPSHAGALLLNTALLNNGLPVSMVLTVAASIAGLPAAKMRCNILLCDTQEG